MISFLREKRQPRFFIQTSSSGLTVLTLLLASIVGVGFLSGCGTPGISQAALSGQLLVVGSTALQPLASAAATRFQQQHPGTHIDVQGGGSVTGLQAVTAHKADVGDSDIYADPALYPDPNLTDHIVCVIPFTMIVNPDVTVTSLTSQQIMDIFSPNGHIHNWQEVGGPNLPIQPVVRPASSGTRDTFRKYVLGEETRMARC